MKMKSVKLTHGFDVIKKEIEDDEDDSAVQPDADADLNHVKQEYHYKEELDIPWDENDNIHVNPAVNLGKSVKLTHGLDVIKKEIEDNEDDPAAQPGKSVKLTHGFDVIKKEIEDDEDDSAVQPDADADLNHVKQKYHYKEELDISWDESDNIHGMGQENYDVSKDLLPKTGFPIVLIERLADDVINKRIPNVRHETKLKNAVPKKCKNRECKNENLLKKSHNCKHCDIQWHYECKNCSKKLFNYRSIINYLNIKGIEKKNYYKYFKCNYKSIDKDEVNDHKSHKCSKCGEQFQSLPALLRHTQTCGQEKCDTKNSAPTSNAIPDKCLHHCVKCNQTMKNDGVGSFHRKKCPNCNSKFSFKCKECSKIFHSYNGINRHFKLSHAVSKDIFKCPECDYETPSIEYLTKHFRKTHYLESHECRKCGKKFKNRISFQSHFQVCKIGATFQCDLCSYICKYKMSLRQHILCVHTTGIEEDCPRCGIKLKNKTCLKVHLSYCKKEPQHQCNICSFKTKYKRELKNHCERVHCDQKKKEICPNCAKQYKNNTSLRVHLKRCEKFVEVPCRYCSRYFKGKSHLNQHIIRAHANIDIANDLPYLHCDDCLYKTKFKGDLVKHVSIHQENNAIGCPKCQVYFKYEYYKKHAGYCGKALFRCDLCDFYTLTKDSLKKHIVNIHSKGNEIDCSKCGRTCRNNNYLKAHLRRCGTEPRLQCNHCQYKTKYKYVLKKHIEKTHTE